MQVKEFVDTYGLPHLGANIRRYKWLIWEGIEKEGAFGQFVRIKPTEGKFIHNDGTYSLFKTAASEFLVVASELIADTFSLGDKVRLEFYNMVGFDGLAANGSEDPEEVVNGIRCTTYMLTGGIVYLPVKWEGRHIHRKESIYAKWPTIQNPYLIDLVTQLEGLKVSSYRNLVSVLVDAKATTPVLVDPPEDKSYDDDKTKWPSVSTTLNSTKFKGLFTLRYDRALDTYEIVLAHDGGQTDVLDNVHFTDLSTILAERIDDGSWKQVKTTLLKAAPKKKAVPA